jgi:protein TonB
MSSTDDGRKGPNRLLQGMILVSLGIHALVIMHITDIYRLKTLQYIEFSLQENTKPFIRSIPRPPQLSKADVKPVTPKAFQRTPMQLPDANQIRIGPGDIHLPSSLMEGVSSAKGIGLPTKQDYYEMVRLRIDREKKYPNEAHSMHYEGKVTLSFVINLEGFVRDLKIVKPCPHKVLNEAALQAVRDSNPFLRPPPRLFKEDILIELNVIFELL